MRWSICDFVGMTVVGSVFFVSLVFWLSIVFGGCGPNAAYLHSDWPAFERECVVYCAPAEAQPSRDQNPWICGCEDALTELMWRSKCNWCARLAVDQQERVRTSPTTSAS